MQCAHFLHKANISEVFRRSWVSSELCKHARIAEHVADAHGVCSIAAFVCLCVVVKAMSHDPGRRSQEAEVQRTLSSLDFIQALTYRGAVLNLEAKLVRLDGLDVASLAVQRGAFACISFCPGGIHLDAL